MKKSCGGCRALEESNGKCSLGHKIKPVVHSKFVVTINYKPLEECPKPKTYNQYLNLRQVTS